MPCFASILLTSLSTVALLTFESLHLVISLTAHFPASQEWSFSKHVSKMPGKRKDRIIKDTASVLLMQKSQQGGQASHKEGHRPGQQVLQSLGQDSRLGLASGPQARVQGDDRSLPRSTDWQGSSIPYRARFSLCA